MRQWRFPVFSWLPSKTSALILEGSAKTPARVRGAREAAARVKEIATRRDLYAWRPKKPGLVDLPGSLDIRAVRPLPAGERYREIADKNYEVTYAETYAEVRLSAPVLAQTWSALTGMAELFDLGLPRVSNAWSDDLEFARQCMQGIAPVLIERATALPRGCP